MIERLTGRPLQTQERLKPVRKNPDADKALAKEISLQTAIERKKRRKEQIRLYKLMKTAKFESKGVAAVSIEPLKPD